MKKRSLIFLLLICIFITGCFETKKNYSNEKEYSDDYLGIIDSYFSGWRTIKQYPSTTKVVYTVNGVDHNYIEPPANDTCTYENGEWTTKCKEIMKDIFDNYIGLYQQMSTEIRIPTSASIIVTSDYRVGNGSTVTYDKVICKYENEKTSCSE